MTSFVPIINHTGLLVEIASESDYDTAFINSVHVCWYLVMGCEECRMWSRCGQVISCFLSTYM